MCVGMEDNLLLVAEGMALFHPPLIIVIFRGYARARLISIINRNSMAIYY